MAKSRFNVESAPLAEAAPPSASQLAIQAQFIELFVSAAEVLGVPRSIGEIYGVIFAAPRPLTFQQIVERLNLSKGSVSQGLKTLRSLGAVRTAYVHGDRRDYFEPETELRNLVAGLLRDRIHPHLEQGRQRLERVRQEVSGGHDLTPTEAQVLRARVTKLENWRKKSALVLPLVAKVLG
jgi:HTH-type transcriptional regulator, glycine betaine synthesis regulator